jgi:hypothetical protein
MAAAHEFTVPDPLDEHIVWRVRYYPHSGRSYWSSLYRDASGRLIAVESMVPACDDPRHEQDDPDYYGGLA